MFDWLNSNPGVVGAIGILVAIILALLGWFGSRNLKIIRATYGKNKEKVNITKKLNNMIKNGVLKVQLSNEIPGFDPASHEKKIGRILYRYRSRWHIREYVENDMIDLP